MNEQEAFEKVTKHLLTQNERAVELDREGTEVCRYRTRSGLMCALGCLIPDDEYMSDIEQHGPGYVKKYVLALSDLDTNFMCDIQMIHDNNEPKKWRDRLEEYALNNDYDWPEGV